MALTTEQQILIESRVANAAKSTGTAYLLLIFLGLLGAHRFYLGRPGSAVLLILASCCFILPGALWVFVDLFLVPGMVAAQKDQLRRDLTLTMLATQQAAAPAAARTAEESPA